MATNVKVLTWDWKEQVDFDQLSRAVSELSGGRVSMALADTESDCFGLVVADGPITEQDATAIWNTWVRDPDAFGID